MAKFLFYAHDPGGANAINPLIVPLIKKGHSVFACGGGAALKILPEVKEFQGNTDELINEIRPNFLITGTSTQDLTEKKLRKSARNAKIQTMAILDHWVNYNRFTPYSCSELRENKRYNELEYLPDYFIVMDELAKKGAVEEGIPEEIIYPLGNPHFGFIKKQFEMLKVDDLRQKLLNGKEKLVVWASEPYIEDYGKGMELECLKDLSDLIPANCELVIKPHPREKKDKFKEFNIKIADDITSAQAIKASDTVLSMTSMVLIESIIAGKPTLSYQKNETDKNKFILTKIGALSFINDKIALKAKLNAPWETSDFKINYEAEENIIKFIEEKLC